MTPVRGRGCPRQERPFVVPSVAPSVAPLDSFPLFESEIFKPLDGLLRLKSPAATNIPRYFEDNLQQIFKAILEAQAPTPTPTPTSVVSKVLRKKLKACGLDVYREKSHMDCYNFCQQCLDYFATIKVTRSTEIFFAASFL